jgi:MYXO-CTERM domain-containing protein
LDDCAADLSAQLAISLDVSVNIDTHIDTNGDGESEKASCSIGSPGSPKGSVLFWFTSLLAGAAFLVRRRT